MYIDEAGGQMSDRLRRFLERRYKPWRESAICEQGNRYLRHQEDYESSNGLSAETTQFWKLVRAAQISEFDLDSMGCCGRATLASLCI